MGSHAAAVRDRPLSTLSGGWRWKPARTESFETAGKQIVAGLVVVSVAVGILVTVGRSSKARMRGGSREGASPGIKAFRFGETLPDDERAA